MRRPPKQIWALVGLLALAALYGWEEYQGEGAAPLPRSAPLEAAPLDRAPPAAPRAGHIEQLYEARRSGQMVEARGEVSKLLPDDLDGSRHQRFIVRLDSGHTVLISHNIDLAERVAGLERGDAVLFRGQYEWNERGGVVHWTHHDPGGRRPGGWLEHRGERYR